MNQTTIEVDSIPTFQDRENRYTMTVVSGGHRYILHLNREQFNKKCGDAVAAGRLRDIEAQADEASRAFMAFLRRERGRLGNSSLKDFPEEGGARASVEVDGVVVAPPPM